MKKNGDFKLVAGIIVTAIALFLFVYWLASTDDSWKNIRVYEGNYTSYLGVPVGPYRVIIKDQVSDGTWKWSKELHQTVVWFGPLEGKPYPFSFIAYNYQEGEFTELHVWWNLYIAKASRAYGKKPSELKWKDKKNAGIIKLENILAMVNQAVYLFHEDRYMVPQEEWQ